MTIEERLEKLEKELNRANRRNCRLLAGMTLCLALAAFPWIFTPQTLLAQYSVQRPKVIRAAGFVVEDEAGKARATLTVSNEGSLLGLSDEQGNIRAMLRVDKDGPLLELRDEKSKPRAQQRVNKEGPELSLRDEHYRIRATLGATTVTTVDGKQTSWPESSLLLFGPDGKICWQTP